MKNKIPKKKKFVNKAVGQFILIKNSNITLYRKETIQIDKKNYNWKNRCYDLVLKLKFHIYKFITGDEKSIKQNERLESLVRSMETKMKVMQN